jgi:hypothetical protein
LTSLSIGRGEEKKGERILLELEIKRGHNNRDRQNVKILTTFFFFLQNQEDKTGSVLGADIQGRGEDAGKCNRKVNMVQILCTHLWKWKMIPVETIPGRG